MSRADSTSTHADQVDAATTELDRSLRRLHLTRSDRRTVVDDVRADLQAAADDGVDPATLLGPDVDAFARAAIDAGGFTPQPRDHLRVVGGGVITAIAVVAAAYVLIVMVLTPILSAAFTLDGRYPEAGPLVVYGALVLLGLAGTLVGLRQLLAGRPAARETFRRAALLLPIGAAAGIAGLLAAAGAPGYRATPGAVTLQGLYVVLGIAVALGTARWWALHTAPDEHVTASVR